MLNQNPARRLYCSLAVNLIIGLYWSELSSETWTIKELIFGGRGFGYEFWQWKSVSGCGLSWAFVDGGGSDKIFVGSKWKQTFCGWRAPALPRRALWSSKAPLYPPRAHFLPTFPQPPFWQWPSRHCFPPYPPTEALMPFSSNQCSLKP